MMIGHDGFTTARPLKAVQRNLILALTAFLFFLFQTASPAASDTIQLAKLSWEELFDLEVIPVVTSVSRKPEKASMSPAAVFVLTSEDIRRSGATSVPDVLRLVPGLMVSHVNGSTWAISARGFSSRFSSTLLVLIDGRSVYSPLVSGVYWDVQDLLLADIERIEVVRGPGGTTWGANAVNGVINIVTKSAQATGDSLLSLDFSTHGETGVSYRHGEVRNDKQAFRFYVKTYDRKAFQTQGVGLSVDDAAQSRFGFRADWENSKNQRMTLDGTVYTGDSHECLILRKDDGSHNSSPGVYKTDASGGHLRFELTQNPREGEELRLQLYADRARRTDARHEEAFDTLDFDLQHSFKPARNHDFVWGIGYRHLSYDLNGSSYVTFEPESDLVTTKSFFVQDQISLRPRKLFLTIGTKIYNHPYVGTESQPSARLLWTPVERHVFWTAFTEARRIPSIAERTEVFIGQYRDKTTGTLTTVRNVGNTALDSELMKARELGYRFLPSSKFSFDLAYFRQAYSSLAQTAPQGPPPANDAARLPKAGSVNSGVEDIHGFEVSFQWKPAKRFRVSGGHTANWRLSSSTGSHEDLSPRQWFIRTSWEPARKIECDISFKHTNAINSHHGSDAAVPAFNGLDLHIGWHPTDRFDLEIGGTSLLVPWHREFPAQFDFLPSDIPRNYYIQGTWHF